MRTHSHRWAVAVFAVVPALVLLQGCGGASNNGQDAGGTVPSISNMTPTGVPAGTPGITLTVSGNNFMSGAAVHWNGSALTTTRVSLFQLTASVPAANLASAGTANVTVVNPSPGGGTSSAGVFTIGAPGPGANHVISLALEVNAMVWDASRGKIYAALPGAAANGNSVVAIDPRTGTASTPVPVGSEPNLLALSSDAAHLWVGLPGAHAIQRLALPGLTPDLTITLPSNFLGPQEAIAMQAAPVNPNTLAVVVGAGQNAASVLIYDGAVQRPTTMPPNSVVVSWLQWGPDDSTLYGVDGFSSGFEFYVMNVDASGVRMGTTYEQVFDQYDIQGHYDRSTGRVYSQDGSVFDPSTGALAGTFYLRDVIPYACIPDPVEPVVFYLVDDSMHTHGWALRAFDKSTYRQLGNLAIPGASGDVHNLIRWGRAGLAFNTIPWTTGRPATVYFVDGGFINSSASPDVTSGQAVEALPVFTAITPESATVGSSDLVMTVSGSGFQPSATVTWNGGALTTTFRSSTELQAVVPAAKLIGEGRALVSVANSASSSAVNSLAFTVLPASSGLIARNLSSFDITWDAHSSRLYAPVWSADPRYANSVVAIDPASGSVSKVAGVAADPYIVRISRDGTLGYTGYLNVSLATQFHVPALDSVTSWRLDSGQYGHSFMALDIQPAPDAAQTTVIAFGTTYSNYSNGDMAIFDNAVARPQRPQRSERISNAYDSIQWGLDDSVLYAVDNRSTDFELSTVGVDATGATLLRSDPNVLTSFYAKIHFDRGTGYLYADDGYATNPATGNHVGNYNASGLLVPDSSINRVFILGQTSAQSGTSDYTLVSFDLAHYTPVAALTLRNLLAEPRGFTRWGTSGLAIVTYNILPSPTRGPGGMLYVLDDPLFVSATQPVQAGVENLAVALRWQPSRASVSASGKTRRSP